MWLHTFDATASDGSQPRLKEGASHHARRGKNAEAFLIFYTKRKVSALMNAGMKYILEFWMFFKRMLRSRRYSVNNEAVLSKWEHKRYA